MNKPTYSDSFGNRWKTDQINRKSDKAAKEVIDMQFLEHDYNFCEKCRRNDCKPLDASHTVSRKKAKEDGNVEILWKHTNFEILCRKCHQIKDKLNLKFTINEPIT